MAEINLITGYKGTPYVTAKEIGIFNEFAIGAGQWTGTVGYGGTATTKKKRKNRP